MGSAPQGRGCFAPSTWLFKGLFVGPQTGAQGVWAACLSHRQGMDT